MSDIYSEADLDALKKRNDAACEMVRRLCLSRNDPKAREWFLSIPARPDHDPDLVIGDALNDGAKAIADLREASSIVPAVLSKPNDSQIDSAGYDWSHYHHPDSPEKRAITAYAFESGALWALHAVGLDDRNVRTSAEAPEDAAQ